MSETHSVSFELSSSEGIEVVQSLFRVLSQNKSIFRVSVEVEATQPFDLEFSGSKNTSVEEAPTKQTPQIVDAALSGQSEEPERESASLDKDGNVEESFDCEHCGADNFDTQQALHGHLSSCESYTSNEDSTIAAEDEDATVERSVQVEHSDKSTEGGVTDDALLEEFNLSPNTWKFRAASTLVNSEHPMTPGEMENQLKGTEWERDKKGLSASLASLYQQDVATRQRRDVENRGANPYEYSIIEEAVDRIQSAEEEAKEEGLLTFESLDSEHTEGDEPEKDITYACENCGIEFPSTDMLDIHNEYRHKEEGNEGASIPVNPDTGAFRVSSVLYHTSKPVLASDIEKRVEDTEWEQDRSVISSVLSGLHNDGLVARERRRSQRGKPYEYELTDGGRDLVEIAIDAANSEGEQTYEEVVEGK
jgi:predicted transcriptional regulator